MDIMAGAPGNSLNLSCQMGRSCDLTPGKTRARLHYSITSHASTLEINTTPPSTLKDWRAFTGRSSVIRGWTPLLFCLAVFSNLRCNFLLSPAICGPTQVDLIPAGDLDNHFQPSILPPPQILQVVIRSKKINTPRPWQMGSSCALTSMGQLLT